MKKTAFLITMLSVAFFAGAQNYKDISDKLLLKQYKQAKEELDKRWTNAKFVSKPDAFILKTAIYAALSTDTTNAQAEQLLADAEAAFATYRQMDAPKMELMSDLVYKEGPVNLYSSLFAKGYKEYRASNWPKAFETFKRVVDISDLLAEMKVLGSFDTTSVLLAGYTAENSGQRDEAFKYYSRLADAKVGGDGNEFLYRFLMIRSYEKNDIASFEKYKTMGKQHYPSSEYFDYDQTDFAVGLSTSFDAKVKALEDVLAKDPNNYKANLTMAQIIFDTLHPKADGVPPAKTDELEAKLVSALNKAGAAKPDDELIYLVLGDHYIDKADKADEARKAHVEDMKKRTKPGTQPSKADVDKRDALDKQYGEAFDKAREPYEKAASILAQKKEKDKLTASQQQQYKKVAGYLGDIYNFKKVQAKGNAADIAKYTAESKKWNDLYDSLRQ
jgi:hypothetical protein